MNWPGLHGVEFVVFSGIVTLSAVAFGFAYLLLSSNRLFLLRRRFRSAANPLEQHNRLLVQVLLQRLVVGGIPDMRDPGQPDDRAVALRALELPGHHL